MFTNAKRKRLCGVVFLGAFASSWNAIITMRLSTATIYLQRNQDRSMELPAEVSTLGNKHHLYTPMPQSAANGIRRFPTEEITSSNTLFDRGKRKPNPQLKLGFNGTRSFTPIGNSQLVVNGIRRFPRTIYMDAGANHNKTKKQRRINIEIKTLHTWKHIEDDSRYPIHDNLSEAECVPTSSWQSQSYPTCNLVHEEADLYAKSAGGEIHYVASGGFNNVFRVNDNERRRSPIILKILSPGKKHMLSIPNKREYNHHNYDIMRRDALVLEKMTNSSHVLPLYGYCAFSVLVPFADGGTLGSLLTSEWSIRRKDWRTISSATRLKYAVEAAAGLADVHDIGVVHADVTVGQYMIHKGRLQLGDFNMGIFLKTNSSTPGTACTFVMTHNYGTTRAPEEYMHKPQTVAVDVWSLGSLLHHILTGSKVWGSGYKKKYAQEAVIQGMRPSLKEGILNMTDPVNKILLKAIDMCYVYEPSQRAPAREVALYLMKGMDEIK